MAASRIPTWPPKALPSQPTGSVRPSRSRACSAEATISSKLKSRGTASLLPCDGPSTVYTVRCGPGLDQWTPRPRVEEQAVPQHDGRTGSSALDMEAREIGADEIGARRDHRESLITSEPVLVTVVFSDTMATSRVAPDRLAVGICWSGCCASSATTWPPPAPTPDTATSANRTSRSSATSDGWNPAHRVGRSSTAEPGGHIRLVNDLADMGYLTRRPDPGRRPGRADRVDQAGPRSDGRCGRSRRRHRASMVGAGGPEELHSGSTRPAASTRRAQTERLRG